MGEENMAKFHFVEDYEAHVSGLLQRYPLDEAMSLAVGGLYREIGVIEERIVSYAGLRNGMSLIDLGCGSGRLAHVLSETMQIEYLGTDIVKELLAYAKSKCAPNYRFQLHRELTIPAQDDSVDMICAFSVFTHLLHEESYIYLESMKQKLKPDARIVFSFLEFGQNTDYHWHIFESSVQQRRNPGRIPLNVFLERNAIETWCRHLKYEVVDFIDANESPHGASALGQSVAILRNAT
jgi:ubiquinone/menaquinone biosynthesis C-methylase UbiE